MDYIKVKDKDHLVRDVCSNAIVNVDMDAYNAYIENYKQKYNESQRIQNLEGDVNEIKNDLGEIKNLLRSLVNGSN
jgi:prefoldin subunit 5